MNPETLDGELNPRGHISRLSMGRMLAGDLDAAGKAACEAHLAACLHCTGRYENAKADAADFARRRPSLESLESRAGRRSVGPSLTGWRGRLSDLLNRGFGLRPALAGFALLALASVLWVAKERSPEDLSAKGSPHFQAYLNGSPIHGDTLACAPSDTLQLMLLSEEPVHYAVLYRDDDGPLSAYMVGADEGGKPLGTLRGEALPHSLVLGPGWIRETLFCIWSGHAFTLIEAEAAVRGGDGPARGLYVQIIPLANRAR